MSPKPKAKHHRVQEHVHEFLGSVMLASEPGGDLHNHRFAGVSQPAQKTDSHHVHELKTKTDFYEDHFHKIRVFTGEEIPIFDENGVKIGHVHGASGVTTVVERHSHPFRVATLIENPIAEEVLDNEGGEHGKKKPNKE